MSQTAISFLGADKNIIEDSLIQTEDQSQDLNGYQQELKDGKLHLNNTMQTVSEQDLGNAGAVLDLDFRTGSNSKYVNFNTANLTINVPTINIKASSGQIWVTNTVGANAVLKGTNVITAEGNNLEFSQVIGKVDILYWSASVVKGKVALSIKKDVV